MLQGEEILSQRSQDSEDDDDDEGEQNAPLPQNESEDEVPCHFFLRRLCSHRIQEED